MARSDEAEWWFNAVYEAVQEIPYGRVTSYGHIARLLGRRMLGKSYKLAFQTNEVYMNSTMPKVRTIGVSLFDLTCVRQVGLCLKHLPQNSTNTDHHFHGDNVPWQRVINAKGIISPRLDHSTMLSNVY